MKQDRLWVWTVLGGMALLYVFLLRPEITGLIYDDGIYLLGAKALATGKGYVMLHFQHEPAIVKYPPLFPLTMVPLWWLVPDFPKNLVFFHLLPILFTIAAFALLVRFGKHCLRLPVWLLLIVILLSGIEVRSALYVVNLMSEPLYLLISMGLLGYASQLKQVDRKSVVTLAALSVLLFYTRTVGLAMIPAIALWLRLRGEKKHAVTYLAGACAFCLPWVVWTAMQPQLVLEAGPLQAVPFNRTYTSEWLYVHGAADNIFQRLMQSGVSMAQSLGALVVPALKFYPARLQGWLRQDTNWLAGATGLVLLVWMGIAGARALKNQQTSPLGLYLACYLLLIILWPVEHERLLVAVLPLLWLVLLGKLVSVEWRPMVAAVLLSQFLWVQIPLFANWAEAARDEKMVQNVPFDLWGDFEEGFAALRQISRPGDIVWTHYNGIYPLYADRGTFAFNIAPRRPGRILSYDDYYGAMPDLLEKGGVRYVMIEPLVGNGQVWAPYDEEKVALLQRFPNRFQSVFQSSHGAVAIYRLLPEPVAR